MNPDQFEQIIALNYKAKGYECNVRGGSYDYGVDIIAKKSNISIAIQAKMYDKREVNYEAIMYLYAGVKLLNCSEGLLITTGIVRKNAKEVAKKLGIKIIEKWKPESIGEHEFLNQDTIKNHAINEHHPSFSHLWDNYIKPLSGKTVYTITGKENFIIEVSNDGIKRETSNVKKGFIEIEIFEKIYNVLLNEYQISRDEINHLYPKRASAFIASVFAEVDFISYSGRPAKLSIIKT